MLEVFVLTHHGGLTWSDVHSMTRKERGEYLENLKTEMKRKRGETDAIGMGFKNLFKMLSPGRRRR